MRWSLRILRIAGIDIYVHATFPLLLLWAGYESYSARHQMSDATTGILLVMTLFVIVVLHELGHALTARRFGIRTQDITLLPIGGMARLERIPEDPEQELAVAIAGPAVNVAIAVILFGILAMSHHLVAVNIASLGGGFLQEIMQLNLFMVAFNLLPAFPMDGGRVLRALLAFKLDYVRATTVAAKIGQGMAVLFGLFGMLVLGSPLLLLVAVFVWMGAAQELNVVRMKSALRGIVAGHFMLTVFRVLSPGEALMNVLRTFLAGFQRDFPVVDGDRLVGWLPGEVLLEGLKRLGQAACVSDVMMRQFPAVAPNEPAESVALRLRGERVRSLPVARGGAIVGIVTWESMEAYKAVQNAVHGSGSPGATVAEPAMAEHPAL
jgi:Zn-dependent protease/CBS domain-containing protein